MQLRIGNKPGGYSARVTALNIKFSIFTDTRTFYDGVLFTAFPLPLLCSGAGHFNADADFALKHRCLLSWTKAERCFDSPTHAASLVVVPDPVRCLYRGPTVAHHQSNNIDQRISLSYVPVVWAIKRKSTVSLQISHTYSESLMHARGFHSRIGTLQQEEHSSESEVRILLLRWRMQWNFQMVMKSRLIRSKINA